MLSVCGQKSIDKLGSSGSSASNEQSTILRSIDSTEVLLHDTTKLEEFIQSCGKRASVYDQPYKSHKRGKVRTFQVNLSNLLTSRYPQWSQPTTGTFCPRLERYETVGWHEVSFTNLDQNRDITRPSSSSRAQQESLSRSVQLMNSIDCNGPLLQRNFIRSRKRRCAKIPLSTTT